MDGFLGQYYIKEYIDIFGEKYKDFTTLRPNMTGYNPDEFFSDIPYEKGYNFIYYIEYLIGEEKMEKFFKAYFEDFKYQSIDFDTEHAGVTLAARTNHQIALVYRGAALNRAAEVQGGAYFAGSAI